MTKSRTTGRDKHSHDSEKGERHGRDARAEKRAQFEGGGRRSPLVWVIPLVALAIVAVGAAAMLGRDGSGNAAATTAAAAAQPSTAGDNLAIPLTEVSDGQVHFYAADVNGTTVKYLAAKGTDGKIHTALDACQVCFQAKKGYTQQGDVVVCGNCGRSFPIDQIGVQHGGCNPIPVDSKTKGGQLLIDSAGVAGGVQFFQ